MAASNKVDLLSLTEKEFSKLDTLVSEISDKTALAPHPKDTISIKDTIVHRAHWIDLFLGWYRDGKAGKEVQTPAPGYKWNQLKEYNAKLRDQTRDVSWKDAKAHLTKSHKKLMRLLKSLDNKALYGPKQFDWLNNWTLGRWAEASGPSHYRSATKYIRQILKAVKAPSK